MGVKREWLPASVGSLQVDLAHTSVLPGATLRGTVTLTLAEPVEAAVITVAIEGFQGLQWSLPVGTRNTFSHPKKMTAKLIDVEDVLGRPMEILLLACTSGPSNLSFHRISRLPPRLSVWSKSSRRTCEAPGSKVAATCQPNSRSLVSPNPSLQQACLLVVMKTPDSDPVAQQVAVTHEGKVRSVLRLGRAKPCAIQMHLTSDVIDIATGEIEADVKIQLDVNLKLHHVHLVLYEDVVMSVSKNYDEGGKQDPRVICRQTYTAKHFTPTDGDVSAVTRAVAGRLELKITDLRAEEYGPLVPFLDSRLLKISHRVGVECSFFLGSRVSVSAPVTLIDAVAVSA